MMENSPAETPRNLLSTMEKFMKIFTGTFLGVGLILFFVGLAWGYDYFADGESAKDDDGWVGALVLTLMGAVFAGVGGGIIYYRARQKARRDLLKRTGRKLRGIVTKTYYDTSTSFRAGDEIQYPLIVECEAELGGRKQTFKSNSVWNKIEFKEGQELVIYIDNRDYTNYWVDTGDA